MTHVYGGYCKQGLLTRSVVICLLVLVFTWLPMCAMNIAHKTFSTAPDSPFIPFLRDYMFHFIWILIIPVFLIPLDVIFEHMFKLKERLRWEGFEDLDDIRLMRTFVLDLAISSIGTVIFTWFALQNAPRPMWWAPSVTGAFHMTIYLMLISAIFIALGMSCFSYAMQLARTIRVNISRDAMLSVEVYHGDGCGGLSWVTIPFLRLLVVSIPLYLTGMGIAVVNTFVKHFEWTNPVTLWNLIWPTVFGPMLTVVVIYSTGIRKLLLQEKKRRLNRLSRKLFLMSQSIMGNLECEADEILAKGSRGNRAINDMIDLYKRIDKDFPVWPVPKQWLKVSAGSGPAVSLVSSAIIWIGNAVRHLPDV